MLARDAKAFSTKLRMGIHLSRRDRRILVSSRLSLVRVPLLLSAERSRGSYSHLRSGSRRASLPASPPDVPVPHSHSLSALHRSHAAPVYHYSPTSLTSLFAVTAIGRDVGLLELRGDVACLRAAFAYFRFRMQYSVALTIQSW